MRKQHRYQGVLLTEAVLRKIRVEANGHWIRETGGALVGYVDAHLRLVIVDACGPGPRAQRKLHYVMIDGAAATVFCEAWRRKTAGLVDYVGDWHSHISASTKPSGTDLEAMQTMKDHTISPLLAPVALIMSRLTQRYQLFVLRDERLELIASDELPDTVRTAKSLGL